MKIQNKFIKSLLFIFILSIFFGFITSSKKISNSYIPGKDNDVFDNVYSDGWTQASSTINFKTLFRFGNKLKLKLESLRPGGTPAQVDILLCDENVGSFIVNETKEYIVSLNGICNPKQIKIQTINPVQSINNADHRILGVKINKLKISSRLGFPIPIFESFLKFSLLYFVTGIVFLFLLFLASEYFTRHNTFRFLIAFLKQSNIKFICGILLLLEAFIEIVYSGNDLINVNFLILLILSVFIGIVIWLKQNLSLENSSTKTLKSIKQNQESKIYTYLLITLIILIGGILRFYSLDFGLPSKFHPDETPKVNAILRMINNGDLNPKYFLHPTLLIYLSYFTSHFTSWFAPSYTQDEILRLSGRIVSATAGTFSIYIVFLIGRILYGSIVGLLSATLLSILPLHITCSRYMKEDVLLTFFILLTTFFVIKAIKDKKYFYLLISGACAGFASGTKYSGVLSILIIFSAPFLNKFWNNKTFNFIDLFKFDYDKKVIGYTILAIFLVPIFFVVSTPYSVLDFSNFYAGFSYEKKHMLKGHSVSISAMSQFWMYHFRRSIIPGMTLPLTLVSCFGIGYLLIRAKIEDFLLFSIVILFYMPAEWVKAKPAPQPERYILPCLPFMIIIAVEFIKSITKSKPLIYIFSAFLFLLPAYKSISLASEISDDTRLRMARWISKNIPKGSKILIDWSPYGPILNENDYKIGNFPQGKLIQYLNPNKLKTLGYDYLIISSLVYDRFLTQPQNDTTRKTVIKKILEQSKIIYQEKPASKFGTYGFHNPTLTIIDLRYLH